MPSLGVLNNMFTLVFLMKMVSFTPPSHIGGFIDDKETLPLPNLETYDNSMHNVEDIDLLCTSMNAVKQIVDSNPSLLVHAFINCLKPSCFF